MNNKAFNEITKFCETQKYSKLHQKILLHKYYEDYSYFIDYYKQTEHEEPTDEAIRAFNVTAFSETTLKSNISLANDEIKRFTEKEINKIKNTQSLKNFLFSVLSSVVGSIVFSVILMVLFALAHAQIKTWVGDLYETNSQIEQTITEDK